MEQFGRNVSNLLGYIVLGIIQGLTEVFPVSSSAHLAIGSELLQRLFGFQFSFDGAIFLHIGTFFAILAFYQKDVVGLWRSFVASLIKGPFRWSQKRGSAVEHRNVRTPLLMLLSLSITGLLGITLRDLATRVFDEPLRITLMLIVNGFAILTVVHLASGDSKKMDEIGIMDYSIIGIAQGIAVIPGISRFGMALCAGLMRGLGWFEALKLAFLLSLPTVLAASALEFIFAADNPGNLDTVGVLVGIAASAIGGYLAITVLLMQSLHLRRKLVYFGVYCIIVGLFFHVFFKYLA